MHDYSYSLQVWIFLPSQMGSGSSSLCISVDLSTCFALCLFILNIFPGEREILKISIKNYSVNFHLIRRKLQLPCQQSKLSFKWAIQSWTMTAGLPLSAYAGNNWYIVHILHQENQNMRNRNQHAFKVGGLTLHFFIYKSLAHHLTRIFLGVGGPKPSWDKLSIQAC